LRNFRQGIVNFATMDGMAEFPLPESRAVSLPAWRSERVLEAEILDGLPAEAATQNLRDMARVNRLFGGFAALRGSIRALAGNAPGLRILDVAGGSGATARWLAAQWPDAWVIASDLRPDLLALGNGPRCAADGMALPFPDGAFDVVVSTFFLHHLDEASLKEALREMLRVSRRGVVAVDLVRHPLAYRFLHWTRPLFRWNWITLVDGPRSVQAAFTPDELRRLLRDAGFPGATVRMHHPWFRLSVTIPKSPAAR
jgi:SAM-dependent methyltransferase